MAKKDSKIGSRLKPAAKDLGIGLIIITLSLLLTTSPRLAFGLPLELPPGYEPFGGRIIQKIECHSICVADGGDIGTFLKVGPPREGEFMKTPATKLYEYKNLEEGTWVLGLANDEDKVCKRINYLKSALFRTIKCDKKGEGKEILIMGTSR